MSEINNDFLQSITENSEQNHNITENEFNKLNKQKLLSSIFDDDLKIKFEEKYSQLDEFFAQEWYQIHQTTQKELKDFREIFESQQEKNLNYKKHFLEKYSSQYKELNLDINIFLTDAFENRHTDAMSGFNISEFDNKDDKIWFSEYELEQFAAILDKAMNQMNILWTYKEFKEKYNEVWEQPSILSWKWDIALSNKIDLQEYVLWEADKHLTDNLHDFSEQDLIEMKEENFDITDEQKMKNFIILLWLELWEWIEDIFKFIWNIPACLVILPRYIYNRGVMLGSWWINNSNEVNSEMENDLLLKQNPALMICEILWEKWVQMIKDLWKMMISWKNWDVAMWIVMVAWLLAWWAGAVKFWAKMWKMARVEKIAGKVQHWASKVDDIVWWAWIWHMTWQFKKHPTENDLKSKEYVEKQDELYSEIGKIDFLKEARKQKFNSFVDELVSNTDLSDIPEKELIWKKAKELVEKIIYNKNISSQSLDILEDVRRSIVWNLWWLSLRSLTHILESFETSVSIPKNSNVQKLLENNFWKIDEAEFYAQISIFHDLIKNTLPTSVVQFGKDIDIYWKLSTIKWWQLSSHQLESANNLRKFIDNPDSEIYQAFENFLNSRWIPTDKTPQYMETIAEIIQWHGWNTEFIQVDTLSSIKNVISNIDSSFKKFDNIDDLLNWLVEKWVLSKEKWDNFISQMSEIPEKLDKVRYLKKSFIKEFIENNIWKKLDLDKINIQELEKLFNAYSWIDKQNELLKFLDGQNQNMTYIEDIINWKTRILFENGKLINKYLHTNNWVDLWLEKARFSFNMNDISWYVNPSSEWFTKLIMFNNIEALISSPMNSSLAVLSELKLVIAKEPKWKYREKLKKMYENGLINMEKLWGTYKNKLWEKLKDNAPDYFKDKWIKTFWEAYKEAITFLKGKRNPVDYWDIEKEILQYFKEEFKEMCLNSEMKNLFI